MSQFTAGETYAVTLDGAALTIKIEDASKSDTVSARVESVSSSSSPYHAGSVYEFERNALIA